MYKLHLKSSKSSIFLFLGIVLMPFFYFPVFFGFIIKKRLHLGFVMNSPVIGASGTVGYGVEYEELADFSKIGGISGKGLTLHGQYGNKGERLWPAPSLRARCR